MNVEGAKTPTQRKGVAGVMLCCGGDKDARQDLKSTQNTPSRQPLNNPMVGVGPGGGGAFPGQQQPVSAAMMQQNKGMGMAGVGGMGGMGMGPAGGPGMVPPGMGPDGGMGPPPLSQAGRMGQQQPGMNNMMNSSFDMMRDDFKRPSGISEEVFRQLETVQNRYDSSTAAAFRAVQKSGEMVVRTLDPRQFIRLASETAPKINIDTNDPNSVTSFVEIVKRPGQTLGLYIREGNGMDRNDGVFISRIAIDSAVYSSGCLQLGDEILAVNLVDVTRMSLDDVVIIMSIPRRLVLTTRRSRGRGGAGGGGAYMARENGNGMMGAGFDSGGKATPPVVVYKGGGGGGRSFDYDSRQGSVESPRRDFMPYRDARTLTWDRNPKPDRSDPKYFPVNSLPRQNNQGMPPRSNGDVAMMNSVDGSGMYGGPGGPGGGGPVGGQPMRSGSGGEMDSMSSSMPPPMRELSTAGYPQILTPRGEGPPGAPPGGGPGVPGGGGGGGGGRYPAQGEDYFSPSNEYYGSDQDQGSTGPGRGQRLLHRMASEPGRYRNAAALAGRMAMQSPTSANGAGGGGAGGNGGGRRSYTLQYPSSSSSRHHQYSSRGLHDGGPPGTSSRSRHYSGMDYASDTEALHSPASVSSMRMSRALGRATAAAAAGGHSASSATGIVARSSSLPRTFQREALLRHPELSMEMDRLAQASDPAALLSGLSTDDQLSDSGAVSAPESVITARKRGYRSPSSFSHVPDTSYSRGRSSLGHIYGSAGPGGGRDMRRTPSTSAIYETLRRSKELRESLSRPSSRLSIDNDKMRDSDTQYFSDSEHQMMSLSSYSQRNDARRFRNRTLSGMDTNASATAAALLGRTGSALGHHSSGLGSGPSSLDPSGVLGSLHQRPSSATGLRPITPSSYGAGGIGGDKENGQNFIDLNPAEFMKYKSEVVADDGGSRMSGLLNLHLLAGRGLRTGGRTRRIRDLYCVVEVDHIHKARTVVRSGGINFDWDERFDLDLANNLEVEFLIYSWDPQLRHRLCYRSSLRLETLFSKGQTFQQVALRLHPAGTLYLTLTYQNLHEAYDRARRRVEGPPGVPGVLGGPPAVNKLFGVDLETVLDRESAAMAAATGVSVATTLAVSQVPLIVKRCVEEVERRGLDIIGIYRLCGADSKKRMLRMAFEDAPELVDLSSANVPDINVVTGLLKEYLRELPQPVFSSCLYQMLVDAMGVFLPNDPDGNAKLVFSILDCLPKANRNCLVFIMDHLSKVTSQSARNKMNPHNLSVSFAPVLMLDFSTPRADARTGEAANISEPIQILQYLIEIWPKGQD